MIATLPGPQTQGPETRADPLAYLSPSRLKSYLACPLKFWFEKVVAIPKPVSPSLHLGRTVHAALQAFNKGRWRYRDCSKETVLAAYREAFRVEESDQPVDWKDQKQRHYTEAKGAAVVSAFLASGVHSDDDQPSGVEVRLEANRPDLPIPLLGIVDLVKGDGTPADYKSVSCTPNQEFEGWLHELQLVAYTLLIEDATDQPIPGCELVFLVKTKVPKILVHRMSPPDDAQVARFRSLVLAYVRGVEREDFHPQPGMHCSWCPYRTECSEWTGGNP